MPKYLRCRALKIPFSNIIVIVNVARCRLEKKPFVKLIASFCIIGLNFQRDFTNDSTTKYIKKKDNSKRTLAFVRGKF